MLQYSSAISGTLVAEIFSKAHYADMVMDVLVGLDSVLASCFVYSTCYTVFQLSSSLKLKFSVNYLILLHLPLIKV